MSDKHGPDASRHDEPTLDEAQHRWNDFVDAIGHELRTPLTSIIGFQELLEDGIYGQLPEPTRAAVSRIGSSSHELLALLNGMVDLARPAQAPPELDLEDLPLDALVAEAIETGRRLAPDRDARFTAETPRGFGTIRTDARRIQRALFLAVLASVRATPGGDLHLEAEPLAPGALIRLHGPAFERIPRPPLVDIILDRAREGEDKSLLRICLAVDTLALLGCKVDLVPGDPPTLLIELRDAPQA